jgi:hypothetical protein
MSQSPETSAASLSSSSTGLLASVLASIAAATPPSPADVLSSLVVSYPRFSSLLPTSSSTNSGASTASKGDH